MSTQKKTFNRDEVEALIAEGNLLVIHDDKLLKLNSWVKYHPGGDKAIFHLVGRDGTIEMNIYHSEATLQKMNRFVIGRIEKPWKNFLPPIQGGKFRTRAEQESAKSKLDGSNKQDSTSSVKPHPHDQFLNPEGGKDSLDMLNGFDNDRVKADLEKYPSLDVNTQQHIVKRFHELHKKLQDEGYFNTNYWGYFREFCRISTLFMLCRLFFVWGNGKSMVYMFLSAMCLGFAWHQLVFIVHDAAHLSITHDFNIDSLVSIFIADYIGGLSACWWKRNHNVHHIITNDPVHDPDIQHVPFFAVSTKLLGNVWSTYYEKSLFYDWFAKKLVPIQRYTYHLILCFGRFNLYRLSWDHVLAGRGPRHGQAAKLRYIELIGLSWFCYWFFYWLLTCSIHTAKERWLYLMVSHIATMPVHVQITLSHFGMSTSDLGTDESFPQRQIRTTMDVDCPPWFDYIHGGLQFQAVHHLFPRMPRHNFRSAQKEVIAFCEELGLHYTIYGFGDGNAEVLNKMEEISKQARIFAACTKFCQEEAEKEVWHQPQLSSSGYYIVEQKQSSKEKGHDEDEKSAQI